MARVIDFDVESIYRKLNALEGTQIRYASNQALRIFGYEAKQHLELQMAGRFRNPVPYTLSSVRYRASNLELALSINPDGPKGNAPATYIYPVDAEDGGGKQAYVTRFGRAINKLGISNQFPVPFFGGRGVRLNSYGNMSPGQYTQVLAGLKSGSGVYFSVPDNRSARVNANLRTPGIYQRNGRGGLNLLFTYRRTPPNLSTRYDFAGITLRLAEQRLPRLIDEQLERALR